MILKDKIAVVTGATGGIGSELVKKLDSEGIQLVLVAKSEDELQNLTKELKGENNSYFVCDLSNQEVTEKIGNEISKKYPNIDIFLGAAGIGVYKPIEDATLDDWNNSMNINVSSNFIFIKKLESSLQKSDDPLVLTVGSGAGVIPMAGRSIYCSTKFALRGLMLSLSEEFQRTKVKFCLITLGSTLTNFGPSGLEKKREEQLSGKAYFSPDWVANKLTEIIKDDKREVEYKLYPGDYGLGTWEKPQAK